MLINPVFSYKFGDGWSTGTSPNITADWQASSGKRWTVPVGGGFGKVFKMGGRPVKLSLDGYYSAVRPAGTAPVWTAQVTMTFVFDR